MPTHAARNVLDGIQKQRVGPITCQGLQPMVTVWHRVDMKQNMHHSNVCRLISRTHCHQKDHTLRTYGRFFVACPMLWTWLEKEGTPDANSRYLQAQLWLPFQWTSACEKPFSMGPQGHELFAKDRVPFMSLPDVAGVQQYVPHSQILGAW